MRKSPHDGRRIPIGFLDVSIAIYRRPALHPIHGTLPLDPNGTPTSVAVAATQCLWLDETASKGSPQPSIQHGKSTVGMYKCSHASSSPSLPPSPFCEPPLSGSAIFRSGNLGDGTWLGPTTSGEGLKERGARNSRRRIFHRAARYWHKSRGSRSLAWLLGLPRCLSKAAMAGCVTLVLQQLRDAG